MPEAPTWLRSSTPEASRSADPHGVLFVCTGNICRSAFAEAYLRDRLHQLDISAVPVSSAGIQAVVGHDMDADMSTQACAHGVAGVGHAARQLTGRMLRDADLVVVFGPEHFSWIAQEHPEFLSRCVALGRASDVLATSAMTPGIGKAKVEHIAPLARASSSDAGGWIPDPYGRGPEIAQTVADVIANALDVLIENVDWNR